MPLPDTDLLDQAACLGIAGITGYRALFADGPVRGLDVLMYGAAGGVGSIATQMARVHHVAAQRTDAGPPPPDRWTCADTNAWFANATRAGRWTNAR